MYWNTKNVVADLSKLATVGKVMVSTSGGDYDTENLRIFPKAGGDPMYVCGFNTGKEQTTPDNVEVEFVELTDGFDSRGGLNSDNPNTGKLWLDLRTYFRSQGAKVVPQMRDYF